MRRAALAFAVLGLAGVVWLLLWMGPAREPVKAAGSPTVAVEAAAEPVPERRAPTAGRIRPIAPEVVALPELEPEQLVRIEPRAPLSTFAAPTRKRRDHGRIFRPLIQSAGKLTGSRLAIEIAGLVPTDEDAICTDADGRQWPCGVRARTAFRSFVRGRALTCELPEEINEKRYVVACALGKHDIGNWLVAQGWAAPAPDGPYVQAGDEARAQRRGIYAAAPVIEPAVEPQPFVSALPEPLFQPLGTE